MVAEVRQRELANALGRETTQRQRAEDNEKIARQERDATTRSLEAMLEVTRFSLAHAQTLWARGDVARAKGVFTATAHFLRSAEEQLPTYYLRLHTLAVCGGIKANAVKITRVAISDT